VVFQISPLLIEEILGTAILLTSFNYQLVTLATVLNSILPLKVELVALRMKSFEFLSCLIKLDLCCLGLCNLHFKLLCFASDFDSELLDVQSKLLNLGFISSAILFQSKVIFLLLSGSQSPLFQLLLVPIHLQFELIHFLIRFENHVLDVVQPVLLVSHSLVKLLNFVSQASILPFSDLL
jgi:hypothetical protein